MMVTRLSDWPFGWASGRIGPRGRNLFGATSGIDLFGIGSEVKEKH